MDCPAWKVIPLDDSTRGELSGNVRVTTSGEPDRDLVLLYIIDER
jgi:hypothetical protein